MPSHLGLGLGAGGEGANVVPPDGESGTRTGDGESDDDRRTTAPITPNGKRHSLHHAAAYRPAADDTDDPRHSAGAIEHPAGSDLATAAPSVAAPPGATAPQTVTFPAARPFLETTANGLAQALLQLLRQLQQPLPQLAATPVSPCATPLRSPLPLHATSLTRALPPLTAARAAPTLLLPLPNRPCHLFAHQLTKAFAHGLGRLRLVPLAVSLRPRRVAAGLALLLCRCHCEHGEECDQGEGESADGLHGSSCRRTAGNGSLDAPPTADEHSFVARRDPCRAVGTNRTVPPRSPPRSSLGRW